MNITYGNYNVLPTVRAVYARCTPSVRAKVLGHNKITYNNNNEYYICELQCTSYCNRAVDEMEGTKANLYPPFTPRAILLTPEAVYAACTRGVRQVYAQKS